ncbi:MAG: PqqD family protein [Clostridia bacterium]|nr:PqqD family protein [Clostridia bacterium]
MKIKSGFVLKTIGDNHVVVPVGAQTVDFRSMITLNGSGAFMWEKLAEGCTEEQLLQAVLAEYEADAALVQQDIAAFVKQLRDNDLVEE